MYCPNCGNDMKGNKFCTKCGYSKDAPSTNTVQATPAPTNPTKSSKGGIAVVIIIAVLFILAFIGIFVAIFFFTFKEMIGISTKEFIEMNDIKIPSVYKVTGTKHKICGTSFSISSSEGNMSLKFCEELTEKEVQEYIDYLVDEENYELYEGSDEYNLKKESDGYYIYVAVRRDSINYSYSKEAMIDSNDVVGV